jgi:uncharacterized protein (DUF2236 family)
MGRPTYPVSWLVHRERLLLLGWGRAILLQFAHPLVARAVADHSGFRTERLGGWRRLHRTLGAMLRLTFGEPDEVLAAARRINGIHVRVRGGLGQSEGGFAAGTAYSATDPALLRWVHLTCVDSFLLTYERYVRALTPAERDAYCAETAESESLFGLEPGSLPRDAAELERSMAAMSASRALAVSDTARMLAGAVLHPTPAWLGWPFVGAVRLSTVGLLPPDVRAAYGFAWTPRDARRFSRLVGSVHALHRVLPPGLRYWPIARRAMRRGV